MKLRINVNVLTATTVALAAPANAQVPEQGPRRVVVFGGGMHALAKACPHLESGDLVKLKQQQKDRARADGIGAGEFETLFQTGYNDTRAKLARATPAEKARGCAQFNQLGRIRR